MRDRETEESEATLPIDRRRAVSRTGMAVGSDANGAGDELRAAIYDLYVAQSQLQAVRRSAGYKIACRARGLFVRLFPPEGRLGSLNRFIRRALNIWLDDGLVTLVVRSAFKLSRLAAALRGSGPQGAARSNSDLHRPVRAENAPITRLNLIYQVTPLRHPERVWQWNVGQLLQRLERFNGRRIITIVTGPGERAMDPPEAVVEAFAGHAVEFRIAQNDARRGEAPHFLAAMREIASPDPSEAVFYAHTKGVSHLDQRVVRPWTAAMYHHNLDRLDDALWLLRRCSCAGIAKRYGYFDHLFLNGPPSEWTFPKRPWHRWHYAGNFWWVRHDRLFSRPDWDRLPLHLYAVEGYLANFFTSDEAACLALDGIGEPYDPQTWERAAA